MADRELEWCVYTGRWYPPSEMSDDHVIPLSLGGSDGLTIRASREGNSLVNRTLDEPFASHPFVANMRRIRKISGRRGKVPLVRWPAKVRGYKTQINMSSPKIEAESFRKRHKYGLNTNRPLRGEPFTVSFTFNENDLMRFGCRLALGVGYFLFGSTFREHGFHDRLRTLMNSPTAAVENEFQIMNSQGAGFWALSWPRTLRSPDRLWDEMCARSKGHFVFTDHHVQGIRLGVSLFDGFFRWFFNLAGDGRKFPIGGAFELGAVIELDAAGGFRRTDLRSHIELLMQNLLGGPLIRER